MKHIDAHLPTSTPAVAAKQCPACGLTKPLPEFSNRASGNSHPGSYCYPCQRAYCREHYRKNREDHNRRRREHQRAYVVRNRNLLYEYLSTHGCVDCGNNNPIVLEFDHVRGTKHSEVSTMARQAFPWSRVLAEIQKCEVRCANCHRIRTAAQFMWKGRKAVGMEQEGVGR